MLTPLQKTTLCAAADRIIPADDFPGGSEGADGYLTSLFRRDGPDLPALYAAGLGALDAEAHLRAGVAFAALAAEAQDALLTAVESGATQAPWPVDPAAFFAMLAEHIIEAYYSDPGNGGNVGARSWEMIGFVVNK